MTGIHALTGILAGLYGRQSTGRGTSVQVSLFETAVAILGYNLQSFWERGVQPAKCGSSHESLCPYQAFEAADGPIMVGVANDNLWRKFCEVAGLQDIVDDARFKTNAARVVHRQETLAIVGEALASKTVTEWHSLLSAIGVPCSPINTLNQLLSHPHTEASGVILEYQHPLAGALKGVAQPVRFSDLAREVNLPPPALGEHTDEVLSELGLTDADIAGLRATNVIGEANATANRKAS
jgi:crotonobetainyl-CoA:carnitine CoA-transferase CaiB-like acyl-CoA transferase